MNHREHEDYVTDGVNRNKLSISDV